MTPSPKKHGALFSSTGMIGTSAMQLQHEAMPASIRRQAAKVQRWADEAVDGLMPAFSETSVRKMRKHGATFAQLCAKAGLIRTGQNEQAPVVAARLMAGHYAMSHDVHRLGLKGAWRNLDKTAGTLLAKLVDAMPEYEERMFRVAEEMEMEVRG